MSLDLARIKALCFDVDGTLHDTDDHFVLKLAAWLEPFKSILPQRDPLVTARKLVMLTETPASYLYGIPDRLNLDGVLTSFGDWLYRKGLGKTDQPFRLIEGVIEMLDTLQPNYPLSVVSARGARSTHFFLKQFGIDDCFDAIATAQTCQYTKPSPDPILWAAEKMKVTPSACLMIGDTTVDILAGKAAGAQTVGVLCGFGTEDELQRCGADLILPTTANLVEVLRNQSPDM